MNVYLMHKDITVAELSMTGASLHVLQIFSDDHMPLGVKGVPKNMLDARMERWFQDRCIPKAQPNYKLLMEKAGVSSVTEMPEKSYLCSLTDCYWFKPIKDKANWKDVNFYENGFDESAGRVTLTGDNSIEIENWNVPELTTNGVLPKRWFQGQNGTFYLLKAGTPPDYREVYNETFVSQCATLFGLDAVPYAIYKDAGTGVIYSICPSFIHDDREEFVSLEQLRHSLGGSKQDALDYLYSLGFDVQIDQARGLDYLVKNVDRHFGNLGIIRDPDTLEIKRIAPLFDHGFSMIPPSDKPQLNTTFVNPAVPSPSYASAAAIAADGFIQKLTGKSDMEELVALDNLQWTTSAGVSPMDIMRRARETYRDVYEPAELMRLVSSIGRRLYDLQDRAEQLERIERDVEDLSDI